MKRHSFTLVLSEDDQWTDQLVEDLYEAGCRDGCPHSRAGVVLVTFHREAESLEQAIHSGIANVQKAGCAVTRVEIAPEDLAECAGMGDAGNRASRILRAQDRAV